MGAAIPVIGLAVGAAGTVASISQQSSAASAQKAGIKAQADASAQNTQLQLMNIERQRLFQQYQSQIETLARQQERAFQQQDIYLQQQDLKQQQGIQELNNVSQGVQLDASHQFQNQNLSEQDLQNLQQSQAALQALQQQYQDSYLQAQQQGIAGDLQAAQGGTQIAEQLQNVGLQQDQALRGVSTGVTQLIGQGQTGQLTASDRAQLAGQTNKITEQGMIAGQQGNQALDYLNINANVAQQLKDYLTNRANLTQGMGVEQANQAMLANERQIRQARLAESIQYGLQKTGLSLDQLMQTSAIREQLNALNLLDSAAANRYSLENNQAYLNNLFYDTAASSQKVSATISGGAELAGLKAQASAIQKPNAFSAIGALAQTGIQAYNAFNPVGQQQIAQPQQQFGLINSFSYPAYSGSVGNYEYGTTGSSFSTLPTFGGF